MVVRQDEAGCGFTDGRPEDLPCMDERSVDKADGDADILDELRDDAE